METTVKNFLGPMIEDLSLPLGRQNQQNLAEWAVKDAMINDAVDPHLRFFTEASAMRSSRNGPFPIERLCSPLDSPGGVWTLMTWTSV
jgi:hypothetical protein